MSATLPRRIGFTAGKPPRAPGKAPARSDTPALAARASSAVRAQVDAAHEIAAWVRHAEAANGFGGDATLGSPLSYRLLLRARANRSAHLGALIAAALAQVAAPVREAHAPARPRPGARV